MIECEGSAMPREVYAGNLTLSAQMAGEAYLNRASSLPEQARSLVDGERQEAYGPPDDNLARIGVAWSAIFGCDPIPAWKVALALASLKLVRAAHRADEDSLRDAHGYLILAERLR